MKIDILTLFPKMFAGPFEESILKRASNKKLVNIKIWNLRQFTTDKHQTTDDRSYGGGTGMVLMIEPIYKALKFIKAKKGQKQEKIILMSPRGNLYNQAKAIKLAGLKRLVFICGHYEGADQRISDYLIDEEISIGDYILTGGEIPTMVIVDSLTRLIPGVLSKQDAYKKETFQKIKHLNKKVKILEYPQYTRPEKFLNWQVPKILLSGNHQKIEIWRNKKALALTKKKRPDLLNNQ